MGGRGRRSRFAHRTSRHAQSLRAEEDGGPDERDHDALDREHLRDLRHRFDLRLGALLPRLVASLPVTGMTAWLLRNGINMVLKGRLVESIAAWVVEDLDCHRVLGADVDRRDWQPPRPPEPDR